MSLFKSDPRHLVVPILFLRIDVQFPKTHLFQFLGRGRVGHSVPAYLLHLGSGFHPVPQVGPLIDCVQRPLQVGEKYHRPQSNHEHQRGRNRLELQAEDEAHCAPKGEVFLLLLDRSLVHVCIGLCRIPGAENLQSFHIINT